MRASNSTHFLLAAAGLLLWAGHALGSTLVVSNIESGDPAAHPVRQISGAPMLAGSRCALGAFPGMTANQIDEAFDNGGTATLLDSFVQIGDAFSIGDGDAGTSGHFEISTLEPLKPSSPKAAAAGEVPHLVVFNTPGSANASQVLVLSFPDAAFPHDVEIGLDSYLAIHLRDASPVIGEIDLESGGVTAVEIPSGSHPAYPAWTAMMFPKGTPETDTIPLADPDGDGLDNLTEYALGLDPTTADAGGDPFRVTVGDDRIRLEFDLFVGSPELDAFVETSTTLENGSWQMADGSLAYADPGSPRSDGVEPVFIEVPTSGADESFVRLRFNLRDD